MPRHVVKNGHKKDTCYDEIGLYAQYINTIVKLIVNKIGRRGFVREKQNSLCPLMICVTQIKSTLERRHQR